MYCKSGFEIKKDTLKCVLIVAKCIVNLIDVEIRGEHGSVLIVAKCIVNIEILEINKLLLSY